MLPVKNLCDYFHGRFTMFIYINGGILYSCILYRLCAAGKYTLRLKVLSTVIRRRKTFIAKPFVSYEKIILIWLHNITRSRGFLWRAYVCAEYCR